MRELCVIGLLIFFGIAFVQMPQSWDAAIETAKVAKYQKHNAEIMRAVLAQRKAGIDQGR